MRKNHGFSGASVLAGVVVAFLIFAFANRPGAHSVQLFLDDKLIVEKYIDPRKEVPRLAIDPVSNKVLIVKYNECGRTVAGRKLAVHNMKGTLLKEWSFEGSATGFANPMECKVDELSALRQKDNSALTLTYSSNDFPHGQPIAAIVFSTSSTSAVR